MPCSPLGGFSIIHRGWEAARQDALERENHGHRYRGHAFDALFHEANRARFQRALAFTEHR